MHPPNGRPRVEIRGSRGILRSFQNIVSFCAMSFSSHVGVSWRYSRLIENTRGWRQTRLAFLERKAERTHADHEKKTIESDTPLAAISISNDITVSITDIKVQPITTAGGGMDID